MSETRNGQRYYDTGDASESIKEDYEQLQKENRKLKIIIDRYAWHKKDCMLFSIAEHPKCTCGLQQALLENKNGNK